MQKLSPFPLCPAPWTAPPARIARPGTAEMARPAARLRQSPIRRQTPRTRLTLSAAPAGRAARALQVSTMAPAEMAAPPARPRRRRRAMCPGQVRLRPSPIGGSGGGRGPQQRRLAEPAAPPMRSRTFRASVRPRFPRLRSAAPAELQATALRATAARRRLAPTGSASGPVTVSASVTGGAEALRAWALRNQRKRRRRQLHDRGGGSRRRGLLDLRWSRHRHGDRDRRRGRRKLRRVSGRKRGERHPD